jgi:hypothetical protein
MMIRGGDGSHWEGCEDVHHDCKIAKLEKENLDLKIKLEEWKTKVEDAAQQIEILKEENQRIKEFAMGRGMVSEADNMPEVAVLVCGLHDKITMLEEALDTKQRVYDRLLKDYMELKCAKYNC